MAQREMKIIKRVGAIPVEAVCAACNREFVVLPPFTKTQGQAKATLDFAFLEHKCQPDEAEHVA